MRSRTNTLTSLMAVLAGSVIALTGCGGGGSGATPSSTSASSSSSSTPASSSAPANATTVTVTEKEFSIALSETAFKPGSYTFKVANQGKFPHNLVVEGPGVDKAATATLQGGQSGDVTVTLQAGSYELWCSVDGHKGKGMDMKVTVA